MTAATPPTTPASVDVTAHQVVARGVHKSFGHLEVLRGVDLTVDRGEVVTLLGPSGSGKTTFLRLINQMETLSGGRIWVDGELIGVEERAGKLYVRKDSDIARQRSRIGMVFEVAMQRYSLLTIGDGLVAQIPSLLLSTTAAIMVTRVNSARDMSDQVLEQMFESPRAVTVASGVLLIMGLVVGAVMALGLRRR